MAFHEIYKFQIFWYHIEKLKNKVNKNKQKGKRRSYRC